jgi:hypothetical protein
MNYAVEMGSGSIIYIPSFIKIISGIQSLNILYRNFKILYYGVFRINFLYCIVAKYMSDEKSFLVKYTEFIVTADRYII